MKTPEQDRISRWTGWILFFVVLTAVASGAREMGYSWDEALAHFQGSEIIRDWLSQAQEKIFAGQWSALWDPAFHRQFWPLVTPENQNHFNFNYHPPLTRMLPTFTLLR